MHFEAALRVCANGCNALDCLVCRSDRRVVDPADGKAESSPYGEKWRFPRVCTALLPPQILLPFPLCRPPRRERSEAEMLTPRRQVQDGGDLADVSQPRRLRRHLLLAIVICHWFDLLVNYHVNKLSLYWGLGIGKAASTSTCSIRMKTPTRYGLRNAMYPWACGRTELSRPVPSTAAAKESPWWPLKAVSHQSARASTTATPSRIQRLEAFEKYAHQALHVP